MSQGNEVQLIHFYHVFRHFVVNPVLPCQTFDPFRPENDNAWHQSFTQMLNPLGGKDRSIDFHVSFCLASPKICKHLRPSLSKPWTGLPDQTFKKSSNHITRINEDSLTAVLHTKLNQQQPMVILRCWGRFIIFCTLHKTMSLLKKFSEE